MTEVSSKETLAERGFFLTDGFNLNVKEIVFWHQGSSCGKESFQLKNKGT